MALKYKDYILDEAAVETISAGLQEYLNKQNTERRNLQRIRLTAEELLLNIMDRFGTGTQISVGIGKHFGQQLFRLRYETPPYDPTSDSISPWSNDMMLSLGLSPSWSYRGKVNTVSLVLADRPKRGTVFYIVLALLSAILLGFIGNYLPDPVRQGLNDTVLIPVSNGFMGLLRTFSGLMKALTICSGLLSMGDSVTLGRTGRSVLSKFIGISFALCIVTVISVLPILNLNFSADSEGRLSQVQGISQMLFDILPTDIIEPFRTGNALQIIVIAILLGCGLLAIGERGMGIRSLTDEAAILMQHTVSSICALIPIFVFVMLLSQIWSGNAMALLTIIKPLILTFIVTTVMAAIIWIISSLFLRCPPMTLLEKVLPPFIVAFTTASSISALPLSMETCEKKLGIKGSTVSFMFPLGSVIYMPASIIYFSILVCTLAETYQVGISPSWLIMAVVVVTLIVIALPPVPGGAILAYTVLFATLGIPDEALILAATVDILTDFLDTGFNVMLLIFRLACEANSLKCLDRETLLRK